MTGDCPFCHMDDSRHLFGDEQVFAVWDGYPVSPGHLLIITRRNVTQWFEATWEEQQAILRALDQGRRMIREQHAADGFNIGVSRDECRGGTRTANSPPLLQTTRRPPCRPVQWME
jgi:diadenosine tetraphosphate (Ap4A) HIT family hydrolase